MKIGIVGSGVVGQTLGAKLVELGHDVALGTRDPQNLDDKRHMAVTLREWLGRVQEKAKVLAFKGAASHGELLINATEGQVSVDALQMADAGNVGQRVLMDVANELDFSKGAPPAVLASQQRCVGERIQTAFPNLRVVKTLNTVSAPMMVNPKGLAGGDHTMFVSGNDRNAKEQVSDLLRSFGWTDILDLGGIAEARAQEMYMAVWLRLWGATKSLNINVKVQR